MILDTIQTTIPTARQKRSVVWETLKVINNQVVQTLEEIIIAHTSDPFIKAYARALPEDVKNWKYLGWGEVKPGKHPETIAFAYYKTTVNRQIRYVNVRLHKMLGETPYAVTDLIDRKNLIKGKIPQKYIDEIKK